MSNEWTSAYGNHQIRLSTFGDNARLYVDGELLDLTNDIYASEDEPTLVGMFGDLKIEAFANSADLTIRINGDWIGTHTYAAASD